LENRSFRGFLQSGDGIIVKVLKTNRRTITFKTAFLLPEDFIARLKSQSEHIIFSERSRIARLGISIQSARPTTKHLEGNTLVLDLKASSVIPGYPGLDELKDFFTTGLPVGRLVFCNPNNLLSSEEVLEAIENADLKLPASTTISSDGSILISPHKVVCRLKHDLDKDTIGRILHKEDGREILNLYQLREPVPAVTIPPGEGVVTTCSMYLNDHYIALQSGFSLGKQLPATILDPIKTRGIRIYLEIINGSRHPIVNPLISAKIYRVPKPKKRKPIKTSLRGVTLFVYEDMKRLEEKMSEKGEKCPYNPLAVIPNQKKVLDGAVSFSKAPAIINKKRRRTDRVKNSRVLLPECNSVLSSDVAKIHDLLSNAPGILALKYFPNLVEHRDIMNLISEGLLEAIYFFEASCEYGSFLSEQDHVHLQEYDAFGIDVYWVSGLNSSLMIHTMRDGKGYFVMPERLADFHKSMLFAFYGSNMVLSDSGNDRLGRLMNALIDFWGNHIGIVTGDGSGVMAQANILARERGILSGANYLDITDQAMTTDVDFCQVFQATCRHSRQKWFEIASFPIFNVGGLGSLEELGITLCNMKLSIMDPVPVILFDTERKGLFWSGIKDQIDLMVKMKRAPEWVRDNLIMTDDPDEVIDAYRTRLHLF
jgi:predicted Rossmann-fold nucleotide-binding protein